jgi:hypothetical protein
MNMYENISFIRFKIYLLKSYKQYISKFGIRMCKQIKLIISVFKLQDFSD